jgi:hypothetical protein
MAAKLKLIPGSTIRWGARRFVVVDYIGLDAVIAREVGKRIRSHRRRQPLENHNRSRFSFANSALLFAFNSRLPAQIRK